MKYSLLTLHVKDMEKSLAFYSGLMGMPILRRQPAGPGRELVFLGEEGQPNLELIPTDEDISYSGFSIGFDVGDLEAAKRRLVEGGYPVQREFSPGPSTTLCFFIGPNGEEVELVAHN